MNRDEILHWANQLFFDGRGMEIQAHQDIRSIRDLRNLILTSDSFLQANPAFAAREALWQLHRARLAGKPVKLSIGSASIRFKGWIATDKASLDITDARQWAWYFSDLPITNILAEHVLEHLTWDENCTALREATRYLAPGGRMRLAVPDGWHPDPDYVAAVRPGGHGLSADDHKLLFTKDMLTDLIEQAGLVAEPLEYFDQAGQFHHHPWSPEDGMIRRSAHHDPRNRDGKLVYTSIIMDAVRPA